MATKRVAAANVPNASKSTASATMQELNVIPIFVNVLGVITLARQKMPLRIHQNLYQWTVMPRMSTCFLEKGCTFPLQNMVLEMIPTRMIDILVSQKEYPSLAR